MVMRRTMDINYKLNGTTGHLDDYYGDADFRCHYCRVTGLILLRISSSVFRGLYFKLGGLKHIYCIVADLSLEPYLQNTLPPEATLEQLMSFYFFEKQLPSEFTDEKLASATGEWMALDDVTVEQMVLDAVTVGWLTSGIASVNQASIFATVTVLLQIYCPPGL